MGNVQQPAVQARAFGVDCGVCKQRFVALRRLGCAEFLFVDCTRLKRQKADVGVRVGGTVLLLADAKVGKCKVALQRRFVLRRDLAAVLGNQRLEHADRGLGQPTVQVLFGDFALQQQTLQQVALACQVLLQARDLARLQVPGVVPGALCCGELRQATHHVLGFIALPGPERHGQGG